MSKAFEAKKHVLKAYPIKSNAAISLFLDYIEMSESDFEYEFNESAETYIYKDNPK